MAGDLISIVQRDMKLRKYNLQSLYPILFYGILAFLFNFIWEFLHAPRLYAAHTFDMSFWPLMVYASSVDTVILFLIFFGGALLWKNWRWFLRKDVAMQRLYVVGAGVAVAAIIEIKAVYIFHQWSYSALMPTVFGIGLSPLLQLALTALGVLWLCRAVFSR